MTCHLSDGLIANYFLTDYGTVNSLFLQPITIVRLSFIIHKRPTRLLFQMSRFAEYDFPSKIIGFSLCFIFPIIYTIISRYEFYIINRRRTQHSISHSVIFIFALMNNVAMKNSPYAASRIITIAVLFFTLFVSALYQSTILKNLNTNKLLGQMESIDQLISENYTVGMPPYIALLFREEGTNKISRALQNGKMDFMDALIRPEEAIEKLKYEKRLAYLWTSLYTGNYLDQFFDEDGEDLIEAVPENAYEFYISLMAPKHSPFIETFNEILLRYVESGIAHYSLEQADNDNDKIRIQRILNGQTEKKKSKSLKFNDLIIAFEIFALLCFCSILMFFIEIAYFYSTV